MSKVCDGLWEVTEGNLLTKFLSVFGISVGSCHGVLLEVLNVKDVLEHFVYRMLTPEQKRNTHEHFR